MRLERQYMYKKEYDLICSLGANCSAASQLRFRNLRGISLPFDWTYYVTQESIYKLADGLKDNFSNFLKKENLRKLEGDEYSNAHNDRVQFEDTYSKIYFYNHFNLNNHEEKEINIGIKKFKKRCKRFDYFLSNANNVLLILSVKESLGIECIKYLQDKLKEKYPNTDVTIIYQIFNSGEDSFEDLGNLKIYKHKRSENLYDYQKSNYEWRFLDDLKLSKKYYKMAKSANNKGLAAIIKASPPPS